MATRSRVKQDARRIEDHPTSVGLPDLQSAFLEYMEMASLVGFVIAGTTAQPPRVENASGERELLEKGCESIHLRLQDSSTILLVTMSIAFFAMISLCST